MDGYRFLYLVTELTEEYDHEKIVSFRINRMYNKCFWNIPIELSIRQLNISVKFQRKIGIPDKNVYSLFYHVYHSIRSFRKSL